MTTPKTLLTLAPIFWPKMPPLGIAYLEANASKEGFPVSVLDLNNIFYNLASADFKKEWLVSCNTSLEDDILNLIKKNHPREYQRALEQMLGYDIIGFSCFRSNLKTTIELAKTLKAAKKQLKIVFGGPEMARLYFKDRNSMERDFAGFCDLAVIGEGEQSFLDYLNGRPTEKVSAFQELNDLSRLAFPQYDGVDLASYPRKKSISLLFSRGCVRRCCFCSERLLYRTFRSRPVESVIEEIRFHKEKNKIEYFIFHDSMFNADLKKLESFCDAVIKNFGSIPWEAQMAVQPHMKQRLFEKIKQSGCYNIFVGLESGSDRTLQRMNKGFVAKEAVEFFKKLKTAQLNFGISLIVGYPGETEEDFQESLDFVLRYRDLIPKIEQINPFVYYDGTNVDQGGTLREGEGQRRMEVFISAVKEHGMKYTSAFIGNLIEK